MRPTPFVLAFLLPITLSATALAEAPPPFARHVCPDGLEVLVAERHSTPLVTIEIAVHNGAMTESPDYNGLSHLYEHMFFKGNKAMPDQLAYLARTRELGILFDGTTANDRVNYFFTTTSDHFADAMVFMRDAITSPLFDKNELERERVVVTGEMDIGESSPAYFLFEALEKKLYWKYPSRKNGVGERKTVLATTPEKMRTIQQRYYVPNNSVLVVVGDVRAEDVFQRADEIYAGWPRAANPFVKFPLMRHPPPPRSEVVLVTRPVRTFTGRLGWIGPSTLDASAVHTSAADLLEALVSDPGSRFQKDLVDSGACVSAGIVWRTERDDGAIYAFFEAAEDKVEMCLSAFLAELPKIESADYFTDEELKNAQHVTAVGLAQLRESTESYAHLLSYAWANANLDYYVTYLDRLNAVTRADIGRFLDTYVLGKPFILGAVESPELAKKIDKKLLERLAGIGKGGAK